MLTAYAICLCLGGVFVVSSALMGHGHDHSGGLDHGADHVDHGGDSGSGLWLPFLSLRFWTYGLAFFGLTGTSLEGLGASSGSHAFAVSAGVGLFCGTTAALVIRKLSRREVSSLPTALSYVGQQAEVLLDVGPALPGRVRLSVRGSMVDVPAATDGAELFARGQTVLILDVTEDGTARVGAAART
jgi:hypothetical protein